jgi:hypothetical protein
VEATRLLEFCVRITWQFANPIPSVLKETEKGLVIVFEKELPVNHIVLTEDLVEGEGGGCL